MTDPAFGQGTEPITSVTETDGRPVKVRFGDYEITLELGPGETFRRVVEVAVSCDFRNPSQMVISSPSPGPSDLFE